MYFSRVYYLHQWPKNQCWTRNPPRSAILTLYKSVNEYRLLSHFFLDGQVNRFGIYELLYTKWSKNLPEALFGTPPKAHPDTIKPLFSRASNHFSISQLLYTKWSKNHAASTLVSPPAHPDTIIMKAKILIDAFIFFGQIRALCILVEYIIYTKYLKNQCKPWNPKWFRLYKSETNIDSKATFLWWSSKSICVYTNYYTPNDLKIMPVSTFVTPPQAHPATNMPFFFPAGQVNRFVYI